MTSTVWIVLGITGIALALVTLIVTQILLRRWIKRYETENKWEE
jgi:hypothetical protein